MIPVSIEGVRRNFSISSIFIWPFCWATAYRRLSAERAWVCYP